MKYIKRSAQSFKFKNRPRRGLFWAKKIYKEWFEYAKLSPFGYPEEFGDLDDFEFEEWWRHPDYGFELFCEPEEREPLEVVKDINEDKHIKHLRIDLTGDPSRIRLMFRGFLKKNIIHNYKVVSRARFQPSKPQAHIKIQPLKNYRDTYIKREILSKSRADVIEERMSPQPPYQSREERKVEIQNYRKDSERLRSISREVQKAKQIMKNIKRGTFP